VASGHKTIQLIRAEWQSDLSQKAVLAGVLLQLFTTVLVCYLAVQVMPNAVWNAMFWILVLTGTMQGIVKNFIAVPSGRWLYLYQLCDPGSLILAKIIYNGLVMTVLLLGTLLMYSFFLGFYAPQWWPYLLSVWLTGLGVSTVLTLVSAISAKTRHARLIAPVLSLPVIIPVLLAGMSASRKCLESFLPEAFYKDLLVVITLDTLLIYLSLILFGFVWRE